MTDLVEFELYNDTPEITVPVRVDFADNTRPVNFKAGWVRHNPEEARELFRAIREREEQMEGSELIVYQDELIRENLCRIVDMPVKGGKKVSAGTSSDAHHLEDVLGKLLNHIAYRNGLYQSFIGTLFDKNIAAARQGN